MVLFHFDPLHTNNGVLFCFQVFDNYAVTVMIGREPYTLGLFDTAGENFVFYNITVTGFLDILGNLTQQTIYLMLIVSRIEHNDQKVVPDLG